MPKKHNRSSFPKPVTTVHHTLASSDRQNARIQGSGESSSVNQLISHLRRTQVSSPTPDDGGRSPRAFVSPRSVHPSLRNLLEITETPPPRPRPNARSTDVGGHRLRRAPGPAPPESWLSESANDTSQRDEDRSALVAANSERVIYRLERLPGTGFPGSQSLVHILLKSMALNWTWHLDYDGLFLAEIPRHLKVLLLSYIAVYARGQCQTLKGRMRGLKPLFVHPSYHSKVADEEWVTDGYRDHDADASISRLDLGGALGRWMSFKQLTNELLVVKPDPRSQRESEDIVPASWDEEVDSDEASSTPSVPKAIQGLRFENLRYLSLAHPHPASASWNSILHLLSRLSTITHLSLAHWPTPTRTPNAAHARIRHPLHRSITFSYSGTDTYAALDNNWAEAAGILRQLSRSTYCLKWLDLEGCADWLPALAWTGADPDGRPYPPGASGPEWNASWRDMEWIGLGPGWIPEFGDETEPPVASAQTSDHVRLSRSLAASVHSPTRDSDSADLWDVEEERIRYRCAKELEAYREAVRGAVEVHSHVLQIRRDGRGKWIRFSLGIEDLEPDLVERILDPEYLRVFA